MRNILLTALIGISAALFATGGAQGQHLQSTPHAMNAMTAMECPMKVAGADVSIEDTADGIRLTFTTKSGEVAELRRRVEAMANMLREHAVQMKTDECAMMGNKMPGKMMQGMKCAPAPTSPEPEAQPEQPDHGAHHPPN